MSLNEKRKRIYSYILALFMTVNMAGCSMDKKSDDKLEGYDIYSEHFETYTIKELEEDKVEQKYWAGNVVIGINKETNEIKRFIYYHGDASSYLYTNIMNPSIANGTITELFDLDTGKLLFFNKLEDKDLSMGQDTLDQLIEEYDFYFLCNYYEDIEMEYKPWYTKEEINDIAKLFVEKKEKIKRLELSNCI